jgi:hypothetical protein
VTAGIVTQDVTITWGEAGTVIRGGVPGPANAVYFRRGTPVSGWARGTPGSDLRCEAKLSRSPASGGTAGRQQL